MPPAQLLRLRSGLGFLQHCNDLLFAKSLRLHCPLPLSGLYYRSGLNSGFRSVGGKVLKRIAPFPHHIELGVCNDAGNERKLTDG